MAASDGYTGAEIEQSVNEALHDAYTDGRREPTDADLRAALKEIVPIAVTMRETIQAMRRWAEHRAAARFCSGRGPPVTARVEPRPGGERPAPAASSGGSCPVRPLGSSGRKGIASGSL